MGIFDPTGLSMFASYFCDAVLNGVSVARVLGCYPHSMEVQQLALRLFYKVGTMRLEAILRVP